jgi:anti-sigma B factor antagonist
MSQLRILRRRIGEIEILDLDGSLTMGEDSVLLRNTARAVLAGGSTRILLNLEHVRYIDSSGLGELVSAYSTAKREGAKLKLVHLTERVHGLLQMTKLLTIFETFKTEEDAVRSFEDFAAASTFG